MRISLINTLFAPFDSGGAARSVHELASDLVEAGHAVEVHTLAPAGHAPVEELIDGIEVRRFASDASFAPFARRGDDLTRVQKVSWHLRENARSSVHDYLVQAFKRFQPDVIHCNNLAGFGTAAWQATRTIPLVHTMRDFYLVCARSQLHRRGQSCVRHCWDCALLKVPIACAFRRPDIFVGVSQDIVERHRQLGLIRPSDASDVIYNWPVVDGSTTESRSNHPEVRFGMLGNVHETKGVWVAIQAFATLPRALRERSALYIAGPAAASDERRLQAAQASLPQLHYLGQRVEPSDFFGSIDVALVPSQWQEPFGRVAAEARLLGLPVIASRVGGLPEALEAFGGGTLVEDFSSVTAWVDALSEAIQKPCSRDAIAGPERRPVWEQYMSIYRRALKQHSAPE
jgi:glycosyltransferase involved in cell wall biosynthesis